MVDFCFVVPVYKVPYEFLHNCIHHIVNQTYHNIELVLVDDGSPDECGIICDEYASKDDRIRVVHKKNGGLSDARNAGIRVATAKWITFVDGDDWVDIDFTEYFLKLIEPQVEKADIYYFSGYRNYSSKEVICDPYFEDGTRFESYEEREQLQIECCLVPTKVQGSRFFIGSACGKVYNLQFLRENNLYFTIMPYGEDSIYYFYSIEKARCIEYSSRNIYHYRDTEDSMVNKYRDNADAEQDIYLKKLFEFASQYKKSKYFVDYLYFRVFISIQRCIEQKFFNKHNPLHAMQRIKECNSFFSKEPYASLGKHIDYKRLSKNNRYKYILIKLKMYRLLYLSRILFNSINGKQSHKHN